MRNDIAQWIVIALFISAVIWVIVFGGIEIYKDHHAPVDETACRDEFGRGCGEPK